jgi:membrane protein YqaA with SNARE-associated domain
MTGMGESVSLCALFVSSFWAAILLPGRSETVLAAYPLTVGTFYGARKIRALSGDRSRCCMTQVIGEWENRK